MNIIDEILYRQRKIAHLQKKQGSRNIFPLVIARLNREIIELKQQLKQ